MNKRFFTLPPERQSAILNAAFKVFSSSDYKHASMQAIADMGRISKSLLFHYFGNKQGLYLFLWQYAAKQTAQNIQRFRTSETDNPFEMFRRTTRAKCSTMRDFPYLYAFASRAFYETDPSIKSAIQKDIATYTQSGRLLFEQHCDVKYLAEGIDAQTLYQDMLWLSDGYMLKAYNNGIVDANVIEHDFMEIINRWEKHWGNEGAKQ